jgi:short-subunit dehydrogenase
MGLKLMQVFKKHILITGANRGIGLAFAKECATLQNHLYLAIRKEEPELINELKKLGALSVQILESDLSSQSGVEKLVQKMNQFPIDLLFNNAGQLTGGLIESQPLDDIYKMLQVNVNALIHLSRAIIPEMVKRGTGKIINHASVSAVMHFPCASTYAASKAAVWAFTDCIQQELKETGVSTLCLFTPGIKTRMFDEIEVLYSKNIDVVNESMPPEKYARQIIEAVQDDLVYLEPNGTTGMAFRVAQHFKGLFNWGVSQKFKR